MDCNKFDETISSLLNIRNRVRNKLHLINQSKNECSKPFERTNDLELDVERLFHLWGNSLGHFSLSVGNGN